MAFFELKTDPMPFQMTVEGKKPYEIRFDDRGYAVNDVLRLRETVYTGEEMRENKERPAAPLEYTGREMYVLVTGILRGQLYGLKVGWVILTVQGLFFTDGK